MVLRIENLSVGVNGAAGYQPILQGAGLEIPAGRIVALVGGSGSGKTTLGLAVLRLLAPGLQISSGKIIYDGQDLLPLPEAALRRLRGREIGMVFQEPQNAFNPVFRIGDQIEEVLTTHTDLSGSDRQLLGLGTAGPGGSARSPSGSDGLPASIERRAAAAGHAGPGHRGASAAVNCR